MKLYKIKDWEKHFENNRTRDMKVMSWIPVPNKHDGDGYTVLVDHENGAAHLGCWLAILQVASKCGERGTLLRDGKKPHDSASISRLTRLPRSLIQDALERLTSEEIGWVEVVENNDDTEKPQEPAETPHDDAEKPQEPARKGRERREENISREESGGTQNSEPGKNYLVIHKPENAHKVKLESYDDFCRADVTSIACTLAGEFTGPGMGFVNKQLKCLAARKGYDANKACDIFREELHLFWRELKAGESVNSNGAAITARIRELMKNHGGVGK